MVTFVLATYALVTFVHISNISAVTGPILTKHFGPNFFGVIIFVDQNVLGQNFFKTQNIIRAQRFQTRNFIGPKKNSNSNFRRTQIFFNLFFTDQIFGLTILFKNIFQIFFEPKIVFQTRIFFRSQNCQTINVFGSKKKNF